MRDDIRNTFRFLRRQPFFAITVLFTLGLGIGLNTAVFSVLDAVVIRPLRFSKPERLLAVWQRDRKDGSHFVVSPANFLDWQKQTGIFEALCAIQQFQNRDFNLSSADRPDSVKGVRILPSCFPVFLVNPAIGRALTEDDGRPGGSQVVILAHNLWASRFGSDPKVVGKEVRLNGINVKVVWCDAHGL